MNKSSLLKIIVATSFLCGIIIFTYSCKKDKTVGHNTVTTQVMYDFSYSGNLWVGDTISFQSTAPDTNTFLWLFGDGATSTLAAPVHTYNTIPVTNQSYSPDTVTLIINNDTAHAIKKALQIAPGIQRAAAMRTWKRISYSGPNGNIVAYPLPDTSFAITVVSDMVVYMFGDTLRYNPTYSSQSSYYAYTYLNSFNFDPIILSYSNLIDTIGLYVNDDGGALGGQSYTIYHSP